MWTVYKVNLLKTYIALCAISSLLIFVNSWVLISEDIYYNGLGQQLPIESIRKIVDNIQRWTWLIYFITPILYLTKFFFVAICLSIGSFLFKIEVDFKSLLKVVLLSEFVFLLPSLIKLFWFSLISVNYTLIDLQYFSPLSAVNLFERTEIESWLIYPLSLINLFELAYFFILSFLLSKRLESNFIQSFKLVIISYGTGLLIWVLFVTFLTVSLSS